VSEALASLPQEIGLEAEVDPGKMRSYVPARP
jgi:hypothetical protein